MKEYAHLLALLNDAHEIRRFAANRSKVRRLGNARIPSRTRVGRKPLDIAVQRGEFRLLTLHRPTHDGMLYFLFCEPPKKKSHWVFTLCGNSGFGRRQWPMDTLPLVVRMLLFKRDVSCFEFGMSAQALTWLGTYISLWDIR